VLLQFVELVLVLLEPLWVDVREAHEALATVRKIAAKDLVEAVMTSCSAIADVKAWKPAPPLAVGRRRRQDPSPQRRGADAVRAIIDGESH